MKLVMGTAAAVLGVIVIAAAGAAVAEDAAPAPAFQVEQAAIDLGDVTSGSEAVAVFRFHNNGGADVRIVRAKPS
ncbi:MAG TPA: hypothetical protein PKJ99_11980 [Thermoanaerobaculales bacterium]|nr:hypothetical protein [Thermoanaerobaculales bacterium]HPA82967.1 hypothetical protein [Thermoanaerobaculales bacterium]HQL30482.1 hypothetical protein [Thermoanaerobaculales bacterium]HQP44342.1 hypothetical protein [Thermoanaerobaculales bacterium]